MNANTRNVFETVRNRLMRRGGPDAEEAIEHLERLSEPELLVLARNYERMKAAG